MCVCVMVVVLCDVDDVNKIIFVFGVVMLFVSVD